MRSTDAGLAEQAVGIPDQPPQGGGVDQTADGKGALQGNRSMGLYNVGLIRIRQQ